jgi:phage shock protein A
MDVETPGALEDVGARIAAGERSLQAEITALRDELRAVSADVVGLKDSVRALSQRIAHLAAKFDRPRG